MQKDVWLGDNINPEWRALNEGEKELSSVVSYYYDANNNAFINVDFSWVNAIDGQSGVRNYVLQYKLSGVDWDHQSVVTINTWEDGSSAYTYRAENVENGLYDFRVVASDYFDNYVVSEQDNVWLGPGCLPPRRNGALSRRARSRWS